MSDGLGEIVKGVGDWFSSAGDAAGEVVSDGWTSGGYADSAMNAGSAGLAMDGAGSLIADVASGATDWASGIGDSWLTDTAGDYTMDGVAGFDHAASSVSDGWVADNTDLWNSGGYADSAVNAGTGTATVSGMGDSIGSKALEALKTKAGNIDYAGAGLKLGAQALGSLAKGAGSDDMASYLNDVKAREAQAQTFNMDMATKRAGIGDSLATNANAMDPNYYATQQQTATKNRDAAGWAENEANMRTRGFDENAIAAERNRAGLTSSTNQGTSYDAGYQTGTDAKATMLGAAGANYTQVSQPTAGLSTAYSAANSATSAAQKGWGDAIESAFGIVSDNTKKATP